MPMVDYAEWHRREMARKRATGVPGAVGSSSAPGIYQPEYKPESWSEQRKELIETGMGGLKGAAQGAATGASAGPKGAIIGAAIGGVLGSARGYAKEAKEGVKAFKEGDSESLSTNLLMYTNPLTAPLAGWSFTRRKLGLSKDVDPLDWGTRIGKELLGGAQTKIEEKRWDKLKRYGFNVPKWVDDESKKFDVYRKDLPPDFVGYDKEGNWVNNKFAKSRSEKDLTGGDLGQSAAMYETFGGMWDAASQDTKKAIGDLALGNNMVKEFKGTIDIGWDENTLAKAQEILNRDPGVQEAIKNAPKQYVLPEYTLPWERK